MTASRRLWILLLLMALLALGLPSVPVAAQGQALPLLQITQVDTSNFPEVRFFLRGQNLGGTLTDMPVTISEDGQPMDELAREMIPVGTQTVLLLDASGSILDPGQTGDPRYQEVGNVTRRFIERGLLSPQYDWIAAFASAADGSVQPIEGWNRDHQAVANQLYLYQPPIQEGEETPLFDLLYFALRNFSNPEAPVNAARAMILFSDGLGGSSNLDSNDTVGTARDQGIPVHTVLLGPPSDEGLSNMQRIATLTGGRFFQLTSINELDPLWDSVVAERDQLALFYRSPQARPTELLVSATLPNGAAVRSVTAIPGVGVQPAQISFVEPGGDLQITKVAPEHDTPLDQLEPNAVEVQIALAWPDGRERQIRRVEYTLQNDTIVRDEAPFDQVTFPITKLDSGRYTLRVKVVDELGLEGQSDPITFDVTVERPAAPPPPPSTVTIPLVNATVQRDHLTTGASLLGLALGLTALIIAWRRPVYRERFVEGVKGAVKAVTEPFMFNREEALKGGTVKGLLTVEDRGRATSLASYLEVRGGTTRIGRAQEYANLVIDEPRVSRLHCRITEDPSGNLCLYDEGGPSGTFVNHKPIGMDGYVLQSNDLINIGPIQLRFHYPSDEVSPITEPHKINSHEATEPYAQGLPGE